MPNASADDELDLIGWDVLVVGRRQASLFITFAAPSAERTERTLWIDTTFRIEPAKGSEAGATAGSGTGLAHLEPLVTARVEDIVLGGGNLALRFDNGVTLRVANEADAPGSGVWWISASGAD